MTYILSIIVILICIFNRKSKSVFIISFILLWILFGFSSNNGDYQIYLGRYNNYDGIIQGITEPTFTILMRIFNAIHFNYTQFLIVMSLITLLVYKWFIKKHTKEINFVLLLYFIFPFCIDVCQVRFTIATIFTTIGLYFLLSDNKKDLIKYVICILIAGTIHFAALLLLIMIIPKLMKISKTILLTIITISVFSLFLYISPNIKIGGDSILGEKINYVLNYSSDQYTETTVNITILRILIFAGTYIILNRIVSRNLYKNKDNIEGYEKKVKIINLVLKMNIIVLTIIPLLRFSVDLYRAQVTLSLLNAITLSYYYYEKKKKHTINIYYICYVLACIATSVVNLYLLVLRNTNINDIFFALFNNNLLIK